MFEEAKDELQPSFEGKVGWYFVTVKLDLEARGIIERIPKQSPQVIRLKNKGTSHKGDALFVLL